MFKKLLWVMALLLLAGCVTVQTVVPSTQMPDANAGYVAGVFSASGADDYGLGLSNVNGGEEIVLPFADLASPRTGKIVQDRVTRIQLPSGRYRISSWLTFARLTKEKITRKDLPKGAELEFVVSPGRVRYLGKFSAETSFSGFNTHFRIRPKQIAENDLALLLEMAYPNFSMKLLDPQPASVN